MRSIGLISDEFEKVVLTHIVGNYMGNDMSPLYLAIHGKMGNGKTYQTLRICSKHHVSMYYISAAELSGSYESDSISHIQRNLGEARNSYAMCGEYSVFIIDDFHLSIASTESGVGRTVNSQLLTGFLMNLADSAMQDKKQRIPFILLGNDFNHLYAPLTRDGRMDFFEWNPSLNEKKRIVCFSFQDLINNHASQKQLSDLVGQYPDKPISFFTELRHDLFKEDLIDFIISHKNLSVKDMIDLYRPTNSLSRNQEGVVEKLCAFAMKRCQSRSNAEIAHESREGLSHGH